MRRKLINIISILTVFTSCIFTYDPPSEVDKRLVILNNSESNIYYMLSKYDSLSINHSVELYDLIEREIRGVHLIDTIREFRIIPHGSDTVNVYRSLEKEINSSNNGMLNIFFFSENDLKRYNWREIVYDQRFLAKKSYSLNELKDMDWNVTYP